MITLRDISLGYGGLRLAEGVSATFGAGTTTALIGRNGAGKSTLLRAMAGLDPCLSGEILIDGCAVSRMSPQRLAETVAFVNTDRIRIPDLRCRDVVALGRAPYTDWLGRLRREDAEIVDRSLAQVGMSDYADRPLDRMSDGERQRVMVARALAQQTPAILLDEPTSFLDLPNRYGICDLLRRLAHDEGKCIIYSTHELDIALALCDSVALLDTPHLHCMSTDEMRRSGEIERLFGPAVAMHDKP